MKKVDLTLKEEYKYRVIKKLIETEGNKKAAALKLECSQRHINRMILGYKNEGKVYFSHGNKRRKPHHTIPDKHKNDILDLYLNKYPEANFQHFSELLEEHDGIKVSVSTVRNILMDEMIISPKATRRMKKKVKEKLKAAKKTASSKKESAKIQERMVAIEDAHPRRPRSAYFGEMIQMDASVDLWFGGTKTYLHLAVDDCTGSILGAYFDTQETLNGYYHLLHQILINEGIPYMFYTDRRTVFEYKQKKSPSIEEDTFTQFGYACKQLGITIKTTSVPQAKGRVERMFQTLQSRLPLELRLAGANTLEQANVFLNSYIKKYNAKFALSIDHSKSVFEKQPSIEKINLTLAILADRKIDKGHCIRFQNKYFIPTNANGYPVHFHHKTPCMVIQAFDGRIFTSINDKVYALDEIPKHEIKSRQFDYDYVPSVPRNRYVPAMNHPWRPSSFQKHVRAQQHHKLEAEKLFSDKIYSQEIRY